MILNDDILTEYDDFMQININIIDNTITTVNEKVLEIGGNIGRNSLVIASIL